VLQIPDRSLTSTVPRPSVPLLTVAFQVLDIYDCSLGLLRIGPFNYEPLRGVDLWLEQSDDFILQHLSTSPDVEPPHFVMQVRATLKYIQDNQFPAVTVFRDNRPHYFRRDEHSGIWTPVRYWNDEERERVV
jgi:protein N-terminal asparagine amidohydrolase